METFFYEKDAKETTASRTTLQENYYYLQPALAACWNTVTMSKDQNGFIVQRERKREREINKQRKVT
jgi:hypothetical protein